MCKHINSELPQAVRTYIFLYVKSELLGEVQFFLSYVKKSSETPQAVMTLLFCV